MVQTPSRRMRHRLIFVTLVILLASVFLFTYNGRMESSDTRGMLDVMESLYYQGDDLIARTAYYNFPLPDVTGRYPLASGQYEPMQLWLAMPLLWLADKISFLGLAHTVWLFNIGVSAVLGGVLFYYALALGYSEKVGVAAALLLGLGSIIWPYSKTFFREPLATLFLLLAALCVERWRQNGYRAVRWAFGCIGLVVAAWLTKDAMVFAVPLLVVVVVPDSLLQRLHRVSGYALILLGIVLFGFEVFSLWANGLNPTGEAPQYWAFYERVAQWRGVPVYQILDLQYMHMALHTYLLSIGASVWATSPVVLLAIPAGWMAWRGRQTRYLWVAVVVTLTFALGYAALRGSSWFGGLSWPQRFLYPVVPFLMLATLPYLSRLLDRPAPKWMWVALVVLAVYGLWIQFTAVSLPWEQYGKALPPESNGFGEWGGGLNTVSYLRWVVMPRLWGQYPLDFAWVRMNLWAWPVACLVGLALAGVLLWRLLRQTVAPRAGLWLALLGGVGCGGIVAGLAGLYSDPLYDGNRAALHQMVTRLQSEAQAGDVVFLDRTHYIPFFLNYGKFSTPRVVSLPDQPSEQYSPEQAPLLTTANTEQMVTRITPAMIFNFAEGRERLWLLSDASRWLAWRVRPVERFMAAHFYPLIEINSEPADPEVRLIAFSTKPAPPIFGRGAEVRTDAQFGEHIRLLGGTVAGGHEVQAGDALAVSLYWQTDVPLDRAYTVAWFVVSADGGRVIQGVDTQPAWGFAPTTTWTPFAPVLDNRAVLLPADTPAGTYQIWVRLYESDAPEQVLTVTGKDRMDELTALLPLTVVVQTSES